VRTENIINGLQNWSFRDLAFRDFAIPWLDRENVQQVG